MRISDLSSDVCTSDLNHSCANPKTLPHYVRTAIDGESLESFSIHFPPFRIEAQIVWNDDMRAVHLTCHLVFHPKDKGKNSSDRHVKLFVNHLPRPRGVIDGAGKLWILEHGHAFFVRKFSNSERCFAAAPCDHQRQIGRAHV